VVVQNVADGCRDRERDDQRSHAVREMNGDLRRPLGRNDAAEHERKIRNRESRVRMPHRRADENLQIDEDGRACRDAAKHSIVDRIIPGV